MNQLGIAAFVRSRK